MAKNAFAKYRPTRTADARGFGFTETLGAASYIWGFLTYHKDHIYFTCDSREDIKVDDQIEVTDDELYRIQGAEHFPRAGDVMYRLEKVEKPVDESNIS